MFGLKRRGQERAEHPAPITDEDTNEIYRRSVNERVLCLRHEVMQEFERLGFIIYTSSGFLHEATITMAGEVNATPDDEEAKRRIRPIIKRWVIHD